MKEQLNNDRTHETNEEINNELHKERTTSINT